MAVVGAALRAGLIVPRELSVVGHDDTPLATTYEPRLSTVTVNIVGLGCSLAGIALPALDAADPPDTSPELQVTFVARASSGHPRGQGWP